MKITISTVINAPISTVWDCWTTSEHIVNWHFATEEWHCPKAELTLATGERFNYRMEAKDGSMGFDFEGKFSVIRHHEQIHFMLDDDRKVAVSFAQTSDGVQLTETFEAEDEHSAEQQRQGWQAMLNNFKRYVESNFDINSIELSCVIKAPPEKIYRAVLDPEALVKWYAPNGFTAKVHHLDASVGGSYKISFTNFTTGKSHSFGGNYLELVPNKKIRNADVFDDPNLPGEMQTIYELKEVAMGTYLSITQKGLPSTIPPDCCMVGWQESLALLALLVEPDIPD